MKYKTVIYKKCSYCYIVKRNFCRYVYCKKNKKHKQKQI